MNTRAIIVLSLTAGMLLVAPAVGGEEESVRRGGKWVRLSKPVGGTPAGETAIIRRHVHRREYSAAVKAAKKFLKRYPSDALREEVLWLAGEAEMARQRYWQAYKWYEKQLKEFPGGAKLERALTMEMEIARAFLAGKKRKLLKMIPVSAVGDGIEILQRIAQRAPGTQQAELALLAIGDHYFDKGDWEAAVDAYDSYLMLFPKSDRSPYAELRVAEALRRSYDGSEWDETPLIEAEQRYKAFAMRYPGAAREAQVASVLQQLRSQRAAKQYQIAQFYLRAGKSKSAEYYLNLLIRDFPETEWAQRAHGAMTEIAPPGKTVSPARAPADVSAARKEPQG